MKSASKIEDYSLEDYSLTRNIKLEDFEIRRNQSFWDDHMQNILKLDTKIEHFNNII